MDLTHTRGARTSAELLRARRALRAVDSELCAAKETYEDRTRVVREGQQSLQRKEDDISTALVQYNKTLSEIDVRKNAAEKLLAAELRALHARTEEVDELHERRAAVEQEVEDYASECAGLQRYVSYMHDVHKEHAVEFQDIGAVVQRYATLASAHADLLREHKHLSDELEEKRAAHSALLRAATLQQQTAELRSSQLQAIMHNRRRASSVSSEVAGGGGALTLGSHAGGASANLFVQLAQPLRSITNMRRRLEATPHWAHLKHMPDDSAVLGLVHGLGDSVMGAGGESAEAERSDNPGDGEHQGRGNRGAAAKGQPLGRRASGSGPSNSVAFPHGNPLEVAREGGTTAAAGETVARFRGQIAAAVGEAHAIASFIADFEDIVSGYATWKPAPSSLPGNCQGSGGEATGAAAPSAPPAAPKSGSGGGTMETAPTHPHQTPHTTTSPLPSPHGGPSRGQRDPGKGASGPKARAASPGSTASRRSSRAATAADSPRATVHAEDSVRSAFSATATAGKAGTGLQQETGFNSSSASLPMGSLMLSPPGARATATRGELLPGLSTAAKSSALIGRNGESYYFAKGTVLTPELLACIRATMGFARSNGPTRGRFGALASRAGLGTGAVSGGVGGFAASSLLMSMRGVAGGPPGATSLASSSMIMPS